MTTKRLLTATLAIMVAFTFMPGITGQTALAKSKVKKPAKVTGLKVKNISINKDLKSANVTLRWNKAKNVKKYQLYILGEKTWNKYKVVKKTAKNKKKYTKKNLYKVKLRKGKYLVYKYGKKWKLYKTIKKKSTYTYKWYMYEWGWIEGSSKRPATVAKKVKVGVKYKFKVRGVNGKKKGKFSNIVKVYVSKEDVNVEIRWREIDKADDEKEKARDKRVKELNQMEDGEEFVKAMEEDDCNYMYYVSPETNKRYYSLKIKELPLYDKGIYRDELPYDNKYKKEHGKKSYISMCLVSAFNAKTTAMLKDGITVWILDYLPTNAWRSPYSDYNGKFFVTGKTSIKFKEEYHRDYYVDYSAIWGETHHVITCPYASVLYESTRNDFIPLTKEDLDDLFYGLKESAESDKPVRTVDGNRRISDRIGSGRLEKVVKGLFGENSICIDYDHNYDNGTVYEYKYLDENVQKGLELIAPKEGETRDQWFNRLYVDKMDPRP